MVKNIKKYLQQVIRVRYPGKDAVLLEEIENAYRLISRDVQFAARSGNPFDRRLDISAYFLAFIKTLDQQGEDYVTIRNACLEAVNAHARPGNKIAAWLKQLPSKVFILTPLRIPFLKVMHRKVSRKDHPQGFRAGVVTAMEETYGLGYGVDILECGICKLFNRHDYGKYTSILCEFDKLLAGSAGLELIRTGTIAEGAEKCDFRFKRKA